MFQWVKSSKTVGQNVDRMPDISTMTVKHVNQYYFYDKYLVQRLNYACKRMKKCISIKNTTTAVYSIVQQA